MARTFRLERLVESRTSWASWTTFRVVGVNRRTSRPASSRRRRSVAGGQRARLDIGPYDGPFGVAAGQRYSQGPGLAPGVEHAEGAAGGEALDGLHRERGAHPAGRRQVTHPPLDPATESEPASWRG